MNNLENIQYFAVKNLAASVFDFESNQTIKKNARIIHCDVPYSQLPDDNIECSQYVIINFNRTESSTQEFILNYIIDHPAMPFILIDELINKSESSLDIIDRIFVKKCLKLEDKITISYIVKRGLIYLEYNTKSVSVHLADSLARANGESYAESFVKKFNNQKIVVNEQLKILRSESL
jgi:hypothetical protein